MATAKEYHNKKVSCEATPALFKDIYNDISVELDTLNTTLTRLNREENDLTEKLFKEIIEEGFLCVQETILVQKIKYLTLFPPELLNKWLADESKVQQTLPDGVPYSFEPQVSSLEIRLDSEKDSQIGDNEDIEEEDDDDTLGDLDD